MLRKRQIAIFVLMGLLWMGGFSTLAQAQELSLEDFISDEPDEENLASPQDNSTDSMPEVPETRLSIRTKGFENSPHESLDVDIRPQDPTQKTDEELAEQIRQEAYNAALTGLFPLNSDHIRSLLHEYTETQRAVEEPLNGYPTPRVNVETVSLDPGVPPLSVKTAVGHITTINMLDITGAPWPIQDISWAGDFEVVEPEEGGNILRITPMAIAAYGNMSIRLLTLKTPVVVRLTTHTDEVQYRVDARIPEYGPFAQTPLIDSGIERVAGNKTIISVLDGVVPANASPLTVSGVDGRTTAYKYNNTTYVRTPLTLLSPGWEQSVSSADGMNVYVLNNTPVLLLSDKGRFVRANLKPSKGLTDE